MRIVAGAWRGRTLVAPRGDATRPTADRVRQALFDTLVHAPWGGRALIEDAVVLDVFAGTGALGLEALSRGAREATFIEHAPEAVAALRANIARCKAERVTRIVERSVSVCGNATGPAASLVFLDPPYGMGLISSAMQSLGNGWIAPGAVVVAETGRSEDIPVTAPLDSRIHGTARVTIWRNIG